MKISTRSRSMWSRKIGGGFVDRRGIGARHAGESLILENLDLVQRIVNQVAARYPAHVDRDDLWNAGACGLVEAASRYRAETGVPFAAYAARRIRGAIIDSTRARDWVGRRVRVRIRELAAMEDRLACAGGQLPDEDELARRIHLSVRQLRKARAAGAASIMIRLDDDDQRDALVDLLPEMRSDHSPDRAIEEREIVGTIRTAVRNLPEQQREVIERHYVRGEELQAIAASLDLTQARASQIAMQGINAIRSYMQTLYEGVLEVPCGAPGKRSRAAYVSAMTSGSTWRERLGAGDGPVLVSAG